MRGWDTRKLEAARALYMDKKFEEENKKVKRKDNDKKEEEKKELAVAR